MENYLKKLLGKSWRTNILAILGGLVLITTLILLITGNITVAEMLQIWGGTGAILAVIHAYLGKDAKATHSDYFKDLPPPKYEEK